MEDSSCSRVNEGLTSERRGFIIAAGGEYMLEKVSPSGVFVFYLGNSVALTLVALIVLTVYLQQPGLSTSFLSKSFFLFWLDNG